MQLYIVICNIIKIVFTVAFLKITSFLGDPICYHSFELSDISPKITALDMRDEEKETCFVYAFALFAWITFFFFW